MSKTENGVSEQTLQALFQEGLQAHQAGRLADAEAAYRQILGLDENHADTNHLLGVIAHQVGDHEASVELISKAIQASPSAPAYHCNLGNALYELGRLDEAAASQRQAIALNPDYAMAHNNLGNVLLAQGHRDEAAANYQKAVNLNPDDAQAHLKLGDILNVQGRWEEAAGSYHKALALVPDNAEALTNLGNILTSLGRPQDAAASYQKAIALKPDLTEAHNNLGNALLALGRPEDAATSHRKAITLKPDYADAHTNLGNALKALDQLDDAAESHEQAIALNPDLAEAHCNLGGIRKEQNRFDEAVEAYRRVLALNPDDALVHVNLGWLFYIQAHWQDAIAHYQIVLEHQHDIDAQFGLGLAYLAHGDTSEAREIYAQGIRQFGSEAALKNGAVRDLEELIENNAESEFARRIRAEQGSRMVSERPRPDKTDSARLRPGKRAEASSLEQARSPQKLVRVHRPPTFRLQSQHPHRPAATSDHQPLDALTDHHLTRLDPVDVRTGFDRLDDQAAGSGLITVKKGERVGPGLHGTDVTVHGRRIDRPVDRRWNCQRL